MNENLGNAEKYFFENCKNWFLIPVEEDFQGKRNGLLVT